MKNTQIKTSQKWRGHMTIFYYTKVTSDDCEQKLSLITKNDEYHLLSSSLFFQLVSCSLPPGWAISWRMAEVGLKDHQLVSNWGRLCLVVCDFPWRPLIPHSDRQPERKRKRKKSSMVQQKNKRKSLLKETSLMKTFLKYNQQVISTQKNSKASQIFRSNTIYYGFFSFIKSNWVKTAMLLTSFS